MSKIPENSLLKGFQNKQKIFILYIHIVFTKEINSGKVGTSEYGEKFVSFRMIQFLTSISS